MARPNKILLACCAEDDRETRYILTRPYIRDGWECATDGRIFIRRPTQRGNTNIIGPDGAKICFWTDAYETRPAIIPALDDDDPGPVCIGAVVYIAAKYCRFLRAHKAKVYTAVYNTSRHPLKFTIEPNYEGLLMPVRAGDDPDV